MNITDEVDSVAIDAILGHIYIIWTEIDGLNQDLANSKEECDSSMLVSNALIPCENV